jgi:hypothetical protein
MAIDSFHLACGICSLLFFAVSALLMWRERTTLEPPSQLLFALPRIILISSFFFFVESSSLVALSLLDATSNPYYEHSFTIISDVADDIILLTGARLIVTWRLVALDVTRNSK